MRAPPHASVSRRACHSGVGLPAYLRRNVSSSPLNSSSARASSKACSSSSSACMSASGTYFPPKRPKWPPASGSVEMGDIARESSNETTRFPAIIRGLADRNPAAVEQPRLAAPDEAEHVARANLLRLLFPAKAGRLALIEE